MTHGRAPAQAVTLHHRHEDQRLLPGALRRPHRVDQRVVAGAHPLGEPRRLRRATRGAQRVLQAPAAPHEVEQRRAVQLGHLRAHEPLEWWCTRGQGARHALRRREHSPHAPDLRRHHRLHRHLPRAESPPPPRGWACRCRVLDTRLSLRADMLDAHRRPVRRHRMITSSRASRPPPTRRRSTARTSRRGSRIATRSQAATRSPCSAATAPVTWWATRSPRWAWSAAHRRRAQGVLHHLGGHRERGVGALTRCRPRACELSCSSIAAALLAGCNCGGSNCDVVPLIDAGTQLRALGEPCTACADGLSCQFTSLFVVSASRACGDAGACPSGAASAPATPCTADSDCTSRFAASCLPLDAGPVRGSCASLSCSRSAALPRRRRLRLQVPVLLPPGAPCAAPQTGSACDERARPAVAHRGARAPSRRAGAAREGRLRGGRGPEKHFFSLYNRNAYEKVPSFISADVVLHVFHARFDEDLAAFERAQAGGGAERRSRRASSPARSRSGRSRARPTPRSSRSRSSTPSRSHSSMTVRPSTPGWRRSLAPT